MECWVWVDREGDGGGGMMKAASPPLSCPLLENGTTGGNFNPQRSPPLFKLGQQRACALEVRIHP